jgi:hypothetical protein
VDALHFPAGKLSLDVEIQTHERKCDSDPLTPGISPLGGERVDDVLMNERRRTVCERIAAEFVVGFLL